MRNAFSRKVRLSLLSGLLLVAAAAGVLFTVSRASEAEVLAAANDNAARQKYAYEKGSLTADGSLSAEEKVYLEAYKDALMEDYPGSWPAEQSPEEKAERAGRKAERERVSQEAERQRQEACAREEAWVDAPPSTFDFLQDTQEGECD
jgi:hypothetical protein